MHRYRVEFSATLLDETKLRDFLEREFKIFGAVIVRGGAGYALTEIPPPKTPVESDILRLMADRKPWRRKALLDAFRGVSAPLAMQLALRRMETRGAIAKLRHGVYILSDANAAPDIEIPPLNKVQDRPTEDRAMGLLTKARSAPFLRDELGVTRQRIDQMLKKLIRGKRVRRFEVAGEQDAFVYVRTEFADREAMLIRAPNLRDSRSRVLSSLQPETLVRATDVSHTALVPHAKVADYIEALGAQGLITSFKMGKHRYVSITPRGLQHPQFEKSAIKAAAADVVSDFGEVRVRFLEIIAAIGPVRTIDITYAMPQQLMEEASVSSGRIIQRLTVSGLTEKCEAEEGRHPLYKLTEYGSFVAAMISKGRKQSDAHSLLDLIRSRHAAKSDRLRTISLSRREWVGVGSHTQESIIRTLRAHGRLSTTEIAAKMDVPFQNPRSANLALRTLQQRAIVKESGQGQHGTILWELT
jgi:DNA-binding transcriptional ArsR family regulator